MIKVLIHTTVYFTLLAAFSIKSLGQETGYLIIESNVTEFLLVVDDDFENYLEVTAGDTLALKPGERSFRMIAPSINDNTFKTTIYADSILGANIQISQFFRDARSSYSIIKTGNLRNFWVKTDANSSIYINDQLYGIGEFQGFVAPGKQKVKIVHPDFGSSSFKTETSLYEFNHISRYNEDPVSAPKVVQFLPGARYMMTKQYGKFALSFLGLTVTAVTYLNFEDQFNSKEVEHDRILDLYNSTESTVDAIKYRNSIHDLREDLDTINTKTYLVIGAAISIAAISVIDGFRKPRSGYSVTPKSQINPLVSLIPIKDSNVVTIGGKISLW